ncbi:hypothetical protein L484_021295 [Morus notabilis]|uniref:Uncharacterized protein n=1 Tax=Morus notabilis TaxID=981085 RepID=W9S815_9ROSA|nr:hypothetical protein L484_021295 [Morus notabilis]
MVVVASMICGCNARELVDVGVNFNGTGFGACFEVGGAVGADPVLLVTLNLRAGADGRMATCAQGWRQPSTTRCDKSPVARTTIAMSI